MFEVWDDVHTVTYFKGLAREPVVSSPYLAGVVFGRSDDGISTVIERAGKYLTIVTGQRLGTDTSGRVPYSRSLVSRSCQKKSTRGTKRHLGHLVRMTGHYGDQLKVSGNVPHFRGTVGTSGGQSWPGTVKCHIEHLIFVACNRLAVVELSYVPKFGRFVQRTRSDQRALKVPNCIA